MDSCVTSQRWHASVQSISAPSTLRTKFQAPEHSSRCNHGQIRNLYASEASTASERNQYGIRKPRHRLTRAPRRAHVSRTACAADGTRYNDSSPANGPGFVRASRRQASLENLGSVLTGQPQEEGLQYAEIRADGKKFLEVTLTSMHNVDHGSILGLLCLPATRSGCLEFPLFLNLRAATAVRMAVERGGLPHALESLDRLEDQDLKKIYVCGLDDEMTGGEFLMEDEKKGGTQLVASTFPQAMGVALRYRQPLFIESSALIAANADFINRMLLNPIAREETSDADQLIDLANRMRGVVEGANEARAELARAVAEEKYEDAVRLKREVENAVLKSDVELLKILRDLKDFYLKKMGIFFSL